MKTLYTFILLLLISAGCYAQTYYVYTATKTGSWNDMSVWNIGTRTDAVKKTKVIIPSPFVISVDNAVNSFGLGDVEINIMGTLAIQPATTINLSALSVIQLLGTGSITGTTNTQRITINGVTKYLGSLDKTKTGISVASMASGVSPNGFTVAASLPVTLSNFTIVKNQYGIVLQWSTVSETTNSYFDVERSYNGNNWTTVSTLRGAGSSARDINYSFTDSSAKGTVIYYRLKQADTDGAVTYSPIKTIRNGTVTGAKIYGSAGTIYIELDPAVKKAVVVTVINTSGQPMQQKQFSAGYKISMNLNKRSNGVLIVNVSDNDALNQTSKILL